MSLEFLSKKSWHTKNLGNQEKVWLAEQRASQEEGRVKELQKQIQQEREQEELHRITGHNNKTSFLDKGIDWMYKEGGVGPNKEDTEDFLLGKKFTERDFQTEPAVEQGVERILGRVTTTEKPAISYAIELKEPAAERNRSFAADASENSHIYEEENVFDRNKEFHLRHEDPMYKISMRKKEMEENLKRKKDLFERVSGTKVIVVSNNGRGDEDIPQPQETIRKSHNKSDKRNKKGRRHDERKRGSRESRKKPHRDEKASSRKYHSSSRDTERTRHDNYHRRTDKYSSDERHRKRRRSSSSSSSSMNRKSSKDYRRTNDPRRSKKRSRSPTPTSSAGKIINESSSKNTPSAQEETRGNTDSSNNTYEKSREKPDKIPRFGLQNASLKAGLESLGPAKELLERKRTEKEQSMKEKRMGSSPKSYTPEERNLLLAQMQADADARRNALERSISIQNQQQER